MMRQRTIPDGVNAISRLDLSNVKRKIMEPAPEGKGWTQAQTDEAEKWYRRYLELCLRFPNFPVVPNYPIDSMWHQHILDTRQYAIDCQAIFGEFLHHYPYFGLNGDADVRDGAFDQTNEMYAKLFGEDCKDMATFKKPKMANCGEGGGTSGDGSSCKSDHRDVKGADCFEVLGQEALSSSKGVSCNHGGSGTGCGQGCGRGRESVDFRTLV